LSLLDGCVGVEIIPVVSGINMLRTSGPYLLPKVVMRWPALPVLRCSVVIE